MAVGAQQNTLIEFLLYFLPVSATAECRYPEVLLRRFNVVKDHRTWASVITAKEAFPSLVREGLRLSTLAEQDNIATCANCLPVPLAPIVLVRPLAVLTDAHVKNVW